MYRRGDSQDARATGDHSLHKITYVFQPLLTKVGGQLRACSLKRRPPVPKVAPVPSHNRYRKSAPFPRLFGLYPQMKQNQLPRNNARDDSLTNTSWHPSMGNITHCDVGG